MGQKRDAFRSLKGGSPEKQLSRPNGADLSNGEDASVLQLSRSRNGRTGIKCWGQNK